MSPHGAQKLDKTKLIQPLCVRHQLPLSQLPDGVSPLKSIGLAGLEELLDLQPETVEGALELAGLDGISLCYAAGGIADRGGGFPDLVLLGFSTIHSGS